MVGPELEPRASLSTTTSTHSRRQNTGRGGRMVVPAQSTCQNSFRCSTNPPFKVGLLNIHSDHAQKPQVTPQQTEGTIHLENHSCAPEKQNQWHPFNLKIDSVPTSDQNRPSTVSKPYNVLCQKWNHRQSNI